MVFGVRQLGPQRGWADLPPLVGFPSQNASPGPSTLGVHVGPVAGDIVLLESGRYAHGDRYVLRLAEERGWAARPPLWASLP